MTHFQTIFGDLRMIVLAAVIAVTGFLSLHEYRPFQGFFWNALNGEIWLTESCPMRTTAISPIQLKRAPQPGPQLKWKDEQAPSKNLSALCDLSIPYKWVLAFSVVLIAASVVIRIGKN